MSKILTAVQPNVPEITNVPSTFSAQYNALAGDNHEKIIDGMSTWFELAAQIENQDGSNQVARRLEYPFTQIANLWHVVLYGNRDIWARKPDGKYATDAKGDYIPLAATEEQVRAQRNVRFSATENCNYWENYQANYLKQVETNSGDIARPDLSDDLTYDNIVVRLEEAQRWRAAVLAQYTAAVRMFELITGVRYIYEPFAERAPAANPMGATRKLAASIRSKQV